jgi:hypothetical protein
VRRCPVQSVPSGREPSAPMILKTGLRRVRGSGRRAGDSARHRGQPSRQRHDTAGHHRPRSRPRRLRPVCGSCSGSPRRGRQTCSSTRPGSGTGSGRRAVRRHSIGRDPTAAWAARGRHGSRIAGRGGGPAPGSPGARSRFLSAIAPQLDPHRSIDGQGEPLPGVERVTAASPALDRADRRTGQPSAGPELVLRPAPSMAGGTQLPTKTRELLEVDPRGLGRELGTLELRHSLSMVAARSWPGLNARPTAQQALWASPNVPP